MTRADLSHHRQSIHAAASHNGRVKMGDWNFLGGILEEVHIHSTMVGKIWLTILFIFRMLVLGVAAEDVWNDEQADFICNTEQPGCRNVCYDRAFPISLIRYWVLQVIFVSAPSLVYMGHALYRLRALEKVRQKKKALLRRELELVDVDSVDSRRRIEREIKQVDQGRVNKAPLRGSLLRTYVAHILTRSVVEVAFMTGQYLLYGFQLYPLFKCERDPCPNAVDCYVSRPTEKSVFMVFMQCIAAISLSLNLLEIMHLGFKKIKKAILDFYPRFRDEAYELDDYYSKGIKESVIQISSRKATIASAPTDYNLLERVQGSMFPNLIKPASFLHLQQEDGSKCSVHECECTPTAEQPCSARCDLLVTSKQDGEDFLQISKPLKDDSSSQTTSPESNTIPETPAHSSSFPTLPVSATRRAVRHSASKFSTVLEGKSSDTDSYGGVKASSGHTSPQIHTQQDDKLTQHDNKHTHTLTQLDTHTLTHTQLDTHHSCASESQDESSSGSRPHRPPSSSAKASSTTSSRRAPDLQI